jgi:hypothetical protein
MDPRTLMVELWFETPPQLDNAALAAAVPGSEPAGDNETVLVVHPRFEHIYTDGKRAPIITAVLGPIHNGEREGYVPDPSQTWDWEQAATVLDRCSHAVVLSEWTGPFHPFRNRIAAFVPTVRAAIELTSPVAAWCPNSERVVKPLELLEDELAPLVNVRMFRVEDDGSTLMDTLGLHALGLPDAQCRFDQSEHDPPVIAAMLYDLAAYLLDHGDVIADGDTLGELPWCCRDGQALVAPDRRVLDLRAASRSGP